MIGNAKELSEFTQKKWRKHLILSSQVKNEVLEVNPDIYALLKLEEGKPSPLGLFAEAAFQKKPPQKPHEGKRVLEVWPEEHKRSALFSRRVFADKEGRIYRDINLKGIGSITAIHGKVSVNIPGYKRGNDENDRGGLLSANIALFDRQMSEEFLKAGIRTHRVLGIIALKELIVDGQKLSLAEASRHGFIDKNFRPVVAVRAFGTEARIDDLRCGKDTRNILFNDAKKIVSWELGRKKSLSDKQYAEWFARTLGKNMGLMHKNGWLHNYIAHNITLDCRIVDLDSITELTCECDQNIDFAWAKESLKEFIENMPLKFSIEQKNYYLELFKKSYNRVFPLKARERYFAKISKRKQRERT